MRDRNIKPTVLEINDNTAAALFLEEMSVFSGWSLIDDGVLWGSLVVRMIVVVVSSLFMSFSSLSYFSQKHILATTICLTKVSTPNSFQQTQPKLKKKNAPEL